MDWLATAAVTEMPGPTAAPRPPRPTTTLRRRRRRGGTSRRHGAGEDELGGAMPAISRQRQQPGAEREDGRGKVRARSRRRGGVRRRQGRGRARAPQRPPAMPTAAAALAVGMGELNDSGESVGEIVAAVVALAPGGSVFVGEAARRRRREGGRGTAMAMAALAQSPRTINWSRAWRGARSLQERWPGEWPPARLAEVVVAEVRPTRRRGEESVACQRRGTALRILPFQRPARAWRACNIVSKWLSVTATIAYRARSL